jgi:hypothetical protein
MRRAGTPRLGVGVETTKFSVEIPIACPASAVRRWWTDLPEEYQASDPAEEPYRIVITKKLPNGNELATYWHGPDGKDIRIDETMTLNTDGSWELDLQLPAGFRIHDALRAVSAAGGSLLSITAEVTPLNPEAESGVPALTAWMEGVWRRAAKICERDAR